ncbi:hypothetical protein AB870_24895 (plasmid) [Pandoraea faecigallinarum]|uniref:Uncharacterized protein n=1 Tax=Pandoraea faecigallinarum TaxID=656179 RepID=A0A0H3X395_9BURK|nr:hypothetical protein AB870_24895 [Pandoraea faecigallinarum]
MAQARQQGWLILLGGQHVVRAGGPDPGGDMALAAHGVYGDDRALEPQRIEQLRDGGNLVALLGRAHLPEHHTQAAAIGRHQMDGALAALMRATYGLAIDGDHLTRQCRAQAAHPPHEAGFKLLGVERREHSPESIVRRDTVLQRNMATQPVQLRLPP